MEKPAFHSGERVWHEHTGVADRMAEIGPRVIRDFMPDQHRELFAELPFALLGAVDAAGQPHAALVAGPEGFIRSPDARTLELRYTYASDRELLAALAPGHSVGVLGIQPHTRRRNRANGVVVAASGGVLALGIQQSFGNCPKYITPREPRFEPMADAARPAIEGGARLCAHARHIIEAADTFFIATSASSSRTEQAPPHGADVSHRGGPPGFVAVEEPAEGSVLIVPDYTGNFMFNTLGNLTIHPRAGLLFQDFDYGDLLALTAEAVIVTDPERVEAVPGAQRLLELRVRSQRLLRAASPIRWA